MLNSVNLMGRLTADPELKTTENGNSVVSFSIAVQRSYQRDQVDFIDIVAWRRTAEFICQYFKKGQMIAIEGSLQTRNWTDKEGKNRKSVEVIANNVHFCEGRKQDQTPTEEEPATTVSYADEDLPF